MATHWQEKVHWNSAGLIPVIAQDVINGEVLMLAWMNQESLTLSISEGRAIYWSRSRNRLWRKGEESGNVQKLVEVSLDCDGDTILLKVEQIGGIACHTGRKSCFFQKLDGENWHEVGLVLKDPSEMYSGKIK
ncbi:Phosphoribosyl-AMP cyclohydrolase [Gammaproteobacteria bacterium]